MSNTTRTVTITLDACEVTSAVVSEAMRILHLDDDRTSKPEVTFNIEERDNVVTLSGVSLATGEPGRLSQRTFTKPQGQASARRSTI